VQSYITNPQVIHETIDGETIIIDLETGTYFSLRGAAPVIWNALAAGATSEQIVTRVTANYVVEEEQATSAVSAFLQELVDSHLIASSPGGGPEASPAATSDPVAEPVAFEAPRLERYTDMQDIILLDPVHKVDSQGWPHAASAAPGSA
jgi:hypothetical protein